MRRYLVVAHRTLMGPHVQEYVRACMAQGSCSFHLVVPVYHPSSGAWTDGKIEAVARTRLAEGIDAFRSIGAEVGGEVGDANVVYAISAALRNVDYEADEIVLSTLPPGPSKWLKLDVPSRVRREFDLPVTHLVAESEPAR
jgi:hypothetical protein